MTPPIILIRLQKMKDTNTRGNEMTTNQKIRSLKAGGRIELSRSNGIRVVAERSGDGKTLRIVRETRDVYEVVTTERW